MNHDHHSDQGGMRKWWICAWTEYEKLKVVVLIPQKLCVGFVISLRIECVLI